MLTCLIKTLPEISLIVGIIHLLIMFLVQNENARAYSAMARFWLLISIFFSILYYNQSINDTYFINNAYTLLFIMFIGLATYMLLAASVNWFSSQKRTGIKYDILILCVILCAYALLSANNLISLLLSYITLIILNYCLFKLNYEKQSSEPAFRYMGVSAGIILLFIISCGYLYIETLGNVSFGNIVDMATKKTESIWMFMSLCGLIIPLFYSLGIAPFHMMLEEKAGKSILPVSHYFAIILPLILWGTLFKLNNILYPLYAKSLSSSYMTFAFISIIFGAAGTGARINLYRIGAYSSLYHFGIILLLLSLGNQSAYFSACIYLFAFMLAQNCLYTSFYNLKSHGEYLTSVTALAGLSKHRSFTTATLLLSLFSMAGIPPLVGFLGQLNLVDELLDAQKYISLVVILFFLLLLTKSYLGIIKTVYFETQIKSFDTENKYILFYLLVNVILMVLLTFNPLHIIEKMKDMFYVIYL